MKKLFTFIIAGVLLLSLSACGNGNTASSGEPAASATTSEQPAKPGMSEQSATPQGISPEAADRKSLIVYFSRSGNTRAVATEIQKQTGADIFELVPEKPYAADYNALLDIAKDEQKNKTRPAIAGRINDLGKYDVIFVGFPIWWGDMPMTLYTFFDSYDLSGKTIVPFCTSGGSGLSQTRKSIHTLEPNTTILPGLPVRSSSASASGSAVTEWLNGLALKAAK